MNIGDVLPGRQIGEKYRVDFVYAEEGIRVVITPMEGRNAEEVEIEFATDMRALANAGLVNIERKTDTRFSLDVGGLIDD